MLLFRRGDGVNDRLIRLMHIIPPHLFEFETVTCIKTFDNELLAKDVGQFGTISIPSSGSFLLIVVKVGSLDYKTQM